MEYEVEKIDPKPAAMYQAFIPLSDDDTAVKYMNACVYVNPDWEKEYIRREFEILRDMDAYVEEPRAKLKPIEELGEEFDQIVFYADDTGIRRFQLKARCVPGSTNDNYVYVPSTWLDEVQ